MTPADRLAAIRNSTEMPPEAQLELLVALADEEEAEARAEARVTLGSWTDDQLRPLLRRKSTSPDVMRYFLSQDNLRMDLLTVVLCNRQTPQDAIADLSAVADFETIKILLDNIDRLRTKALIALKNNTTYLAMQQDRATAVEEGFVFEPNLLELLIIEARLEDEREGKVGLTDEEIEAADAEIAAAEASGDDKKKTESTHAKIAKMSVSQKVQLALKGNKEDRSILIRDTSKVIVRAVLGSPKLTDSEAENFSKLTSVTDEVLRIMFMTRKFMKSQAVVRNLANNPRTPLDVALLLVNRLSIIDLKGVAGNKGVSEIVRKMALKMFKQKQT